MPHTDVVAFLADLLLILVSAKVFGELAERWGQPAVLGELLGGVFLGFGLFSFFRPDSPALVLMAELGVILLLFETGLNSDLGELLRAGPVSLSVALVGVAVPFALGWGLMRALGHPAVPAVFVGASLTATSVGITARVLSDMGRLGRRESQIVLGAAVIDDILGIIILSAVQGMALSGSFSWGAAALTAFLAAAFLALALWIGPRLSRLLILVVERMRVRGILIVASVCFAFAMALLADSLGTALIVGAFTAGLLLAHTEKRLDIEGAIRPLSDVFVPVFFVMVGSRVQLGAYNPLVPDNRAMLLLAGLLLVSAVLGKLASGWAAWGPNLNRAAIGIGMIPRGEVGLIFANVGLASGVIGPPLYAAVVGMVAATTFLAPPLLKRVFRETT